MKFGTIVADPPWKFQNWSGRGQGSAAAHYEVRDANWIQRLPVPAIADANCVLLLWACWPLLPEAMETMQAWGFSYKSGFPWLKLTRDLIPRMGIGFHTRACSELLLIGTRGKLKCPAPQDREIGLLMTKQGRHSAKPDEIYGRAELYPGPFLELFARPDGGLDQPRENWWRVGNEIDGLDASEALCRLAALPQPVPILRSAPTSTNRPEPSLFAE